MKFPTFKRQPFGKEREIRDSLYRYILNECTVFFFNPPPLLQHMKEIGICLGSWSRCWNNLRVEQASVASYSVSQVIHNVANIPCPNSKVVNFC